MKGETLEYGRFGHIFGHNFFYSQPI